MDLIKRFFQVWQIENVFQDARHAAEGEIYTKLNQKIDEFIQLADYEWGMTESDGRASGYLMDLINFLRSTFQVFTHLPVSLILQLTMTHRTRRLSLWELWDIVFLILAMNNRNVIIPSFFPCSIDPCLAIYITSLLKCVYNLKVNWFCDFEVELSVLHWWSVVMHGNRAVTDS